MRIIEEMEIPQLSNVNIIAFAILCALEVNKNEEFVSFAKNWLEWANNWLENKDRSIESASAVYDSYGYASSSCAYYAVAAAVDGAFYRDCAANAAAAASYSSISFIKLAEKAMEIK